MNTGVWIPGRMIYAIVPLESTEGVICNPTPGCYIGIISKSFNTADADIYHVTARRNFGIVWINIYRGNCSCWPDDWRNSSIKSIVSALGNYRITVWSKHIPVFLGWNLIMRSAPRWCPAGPPGYAVPRCGTARCSPVPPARWLGCKSYPRRSPSSPGCPCTIQRKAVVLQAQMGDAPSGAYKKFLLFYEKQC